MFLFFQVCLRWEHKSIWTRFLGVSNEASTSSSRVLVRPLAPTIVSTILSSFLCLNLHLLILFFSGNKMKFLSKKWCSESGCQSWEKQNVCSTDEKVLRGYDTEKAMCVYAWMCVLVSEKENPWSGLDSHFVKMGGKITLSCLNCCEGLT